MGTSEKKVACFLQMTKRITMLRIMVLRFELCSIFSSFSLVPVAQRRMLVTDQSRVGAVKRRENLR